MGKNKYIELESNSTSNCSSWEALVLSIDISLAMSLEWSSLFSKASELFMVVGAAAPYVPQMLDIRRRRSSQGFSSMVCLTLLVANTLRVLYWFGHPFETPLLLQSLLMLAVMILLLRECVLFQPLKIKSRQSEAYFSDWRWEDFWQWTDFSSYVQCYLIFAILSSLIMLLLLSSPATWPIEAVGFVALLVEATLGVPQFYKNHNTSSTRGMSVSMVMMWLLGDSFKTAYFVVREAPLQFVMCGLLQITVDLGIILQVITFNSKTMPSV